MRSTGVDAAIVAYPHGASAPVVAEMRGLGIKVVDLSADFRLRDLPTYERWYGEHGEPDLLEGAVYGLTELYRERIAEAELVANPGCYPTATLLALAPLAEAGLIEDVVIDAKSGVSGAGRGVAEEMEVVKRATTPRPTRSTATATRPRSPRSWTRCGGGVGERLAADDLRPAPDALRPGRAGQLLRQQRAARLEAEELARAVREPLRRRSPSSSWSPRRPASARSARRTSAASTSLAAEGGRVFAFAAIDNLWKGAASQAIQNLNLMLGLPEGEGIS